ncbi:hypothetical protein MXD81_60465 [Microbacteriaceae bacterium K1510]|nr:hypothetical protein [Microbacteriaceae bacterium K1510]
MTELELARGRPGRRGRSFQFSGVVVPVAVHPKYLPPGVNHRHTFGLGIGFPNLSAHLLHPGRDPRLSQQWSGVEGRIASAAAQVMGWSTRARPTAASMADIPANALHVLLNGEIPPDDDEARLRQGDPNMLSGELTKLFPIRDVSGSRVRMQAISSPAKFELTPFGASWSRDPAAL